jgi:molybdenum cofactor guanylyltransferase
MSDIGCIILSGGESSRMGQDKGLINLHGKEMIRHVLDAVEGITSEPIIISNKLNYRNISKNVFPDIISGCGPVGGILSGIFHTDCEKNLVLSCDIPLVSPDWLKFLINNSPEDKITISACNGKLHPLVGIYPKLILPDLASAVRENRLKLVDFVKENQALVLDTLLLGDEIPSASFTNFNSPDEIQAAFPGLEVNKT